MESPCALGGGLVGWGHQPFSLSSVGLAHSPALGTPVSTMPRCQQCPGVPLQGPESQRDAHPPPQTHPGATGHPPHKHREQREPCNSCQSPRDSRALPQSASIPGGVLTPDMEDVVCTPQTACLPLILFSFKIKGVQITRCHFPPLSAAILNCARGLIDMKITEGWMALKNI